MQMELKMRDWGFEENRGHGGKNHISEAAVENARKLLKLERRAHPRPTVEVGVKMERTMKTQADSFKLHVVKGHRRQSRKL